MLKCLNDQIQSKAIRSNLILSAYLQTFYFILQKKAKRNQIFLQKKNIFGSLQLPLLNENFVVNVCRRL